MSEDDTSKGSTHILFKIVNNIYHDDPTRECDYQIVALSLISRIHIVNIGFVIVA